MSLLAVEDLHARYGPMHVLFGLDFSVPEGSVVVMLGANGAGKTTTLRAISGLVSASGRITFGGKQVLGRRPEQLAALGIAHVPQGRGTFMQFTVEENLVLGAYTRRDRRAVLREIGEWYSFFPRLQERRRERAGNLSGGEQQMLAVARALMLKPRLLLLDEPSLGLGPKIRTELFATLAEINADHGTTMLIVEQNAQLALEIATSAYVIETGRIVSSHDAGEVVADESLRKAYLGY
jgi:branched-chain amino acid transport system ATP-binding protein